MCHVHKHFVFKGSKWIDKKPTKSSMCNEQQKMYLENHLHTFCNNAADDERNAHVVHFKTIIL